MRTLLLGCMFCLSMSLSSCTMPFWAYIRNTSAFPAIIDVVLLDKHGMRTLPNQVKVAHKIVAFKWGFRQNFYEWENVQWVDTSHFSFTVMPGTSIDLADAAGRFMNSYPVERSFVTVTVNGTVDTLIDRNRNFLHQKFSYTHVGLSVPVLYYDVK